MRKTIIVIVLALVMVFGSAISVSASGYVVGDYTSDISPLVERPLYSDIPQGVAYLDARPLYDSVFYFYTEDDTKAYTNNGYMKNIMIVEIDGDLSFAVPSHLDYVWTLDCYNPNTGSIKETSTSYSKNYQVTINGIEYDLYCTNSTFWNSKLVVEGEKYGAWIDSVNCSLYVDGEYVDFFQSPPILMPIAETQNLGAVMEQVVTMIPIGMVCLVGYVALRKAWATLQTILYRA